MNSKLLSFGLASLAPGLIAASSLVVDGISGDGSLSFSFKAPGNATTSSAKYYVPAINKSAPVVLHEKPHWARGQGPSEEELIAFPVFSVTETDVTEDVLSGLLEDYLKDDDVYVDDFLEGVYLSVAEGTRLDQSAVDFLTSKDVEYLVLPKGVSAPIPCTGSLKVVTVAGYEKVAPGPYVASLGGCDATTFGLRKVYQLVPDLQEAFMNAITPNDDGSFSYVSVWEAAQFGLMIPVPSRLYSSLLDKEKYPLAGLRFAVKDMMPVKGILTSGGSRAMLRLYDTPPNATAPAVETLLGLGATLVGKTKLTVFAFGAWPWQTDDFAYSWNPRADGYLGLSASSFGSAAAIASYDYLDFTVGSDTGGSVRNPADRVGVYGLRPSWDTFDTTLVIPSGTQLDALGFFTKSPALMQRIGRVWMGDSNDALLPDGFSLPKKIIFPAEFFPVNNSVAQEVIDNWLAKVADVMGMTIETQNMTQLLIDNVAANETLASYTSGVGSVSTYDNYQLFGKQFLADYEAKFGGYPALDLAAMTAWRAAPDYTSERKAFMEARRQDFADFVNTHVVPYNEETCTEGLWVYHISDKGGGVPEYRDVITYPDFPPFRPMRAASIAPWAKLVDVTVPIGAISYKSAITKRDEPLVITLNLVAHRGCDRVVLDFLEACGKAGLCKDVKTGRYAF